MNQRATILNDMLNHQSGQEKFVEDGTLMVNVLNKPVGNLWLS